MNTSRKRTGSNFSLMTSGFVIRQYKLDGSTTLAIHQDGDTQNTVYLRNWQPGQFGISLSGEAAEPEMPEITPMPVINRTEKTMQILST